MLTNLLKFEWFYHSKQLSIYLGIFVYFFLGFMLTGHQGLPGLVHINSPYQITLFYLMMGLGVPILSGIVTANAVLRDDVNKFRELIYSSKLNIRQFIYSRCVGLVSSVFLILASMSLAMILRRYFPFGIDGHFSETNLMYYFWVLFIFILPNIIFCASVSFLVAAVTRNVLATWLSGIGIYVLYILVSLVVGSPVVGDSVPASLTSREWMSTLDPFGLSTFHILTELWTVEEKNTLLLSLDGLLLKNRLLWLTISALLILSISRLLKLDLEHLKKNKTKDKNTLVSELQEHNIGQLNFVPVNHPMAQGSAFTSMLKLEINHLLKSYVFWGVMLFWTLLNVGEIITVIMSYDTNPPWYPMTSRLLQRFQHDLLPRFTLFVIVYYSADLIWREHQHKFSMIIDSTPVKNFVTFLAKFVTLTLIPFFMILIAISICLVIQISQGYYDFEPALYLSLFYYGGLPLIFNIALCVFVQGVVPNKTLGMFISAFVLLFSNTNLSNVIGLEHPLFHFAATPSYIYSDMNGYALISQTYMTFMLFWGVLALIFMLAGFALWRRGSQFKLRHRIAQSKYQIGKKGVLTFVILSVIFTGLGSTIFYKTNMETSYYNTDSSKQWRYDYETSYKRFQSIAQPTITEVNTKVDLYPSTERYEAVGTYLLKNRHQKPVNEIMVNFSNNVEMLSMSLVSESGNSITASHRDDKHGVYLFVLDAPLQAGEELKLNFDLQQQQSGFGQFSALSRITKNATMISTSNQFPSIGYMAHRELRNERDRKAFGLDNRKEPELLEDSLKRLQNGNFVDEQPVQFESIISTEGDQTALISGELIKKWNKDNRAYFHYKTRNAIRHVPVYLSSRYQLTASETQGVNVEIYHHPEHDVNIHRIEKAIKDSLEYHIENFGNYAHNTFKHVETAAHTNFSGYAAPGMTLMSEHQGFTFDLRDPNQYDQLYRRTAHEVAHQWWGHRVNPAPLDEGATILVETLARYSGMMIMKKIYGNEMAKRFIRYEIGRYFKRRHTDLIAELPLYRSRNHQQYLMYSKGAAAMFSLQEQIGEEKINQALKKLVEQYSFNKKPVTSVDLIALLSETAPEHSALINSWFKEINHVELAIENAEIKGDDAGNYTLDIEVEMKNFNRDHEGKMFEFKTQKAIEVAVVFTSENPETDTETMIKSFEVKTGGNQLSLVLDKKPQAIILDPDLHHLNKNFEQSNQNWEFNN